MTKSSLLNSMWSLGLRVAATIALTACSSDDLTWTEDARLPDGRVVTVKRWVEFKGGSSGFDSPQVESRQSLEFTNPDTGETVRWRNTRDDGKLSTIALMLDRGKPLLLGKPMYADDRHKYDCPNPPYLLFEYAAGQWRSRPLATIPVAQVRANLTTDALQKRVEIERRSPRHVTAEETSESFTYLDGVYRVPYLIRFEGMPTQTLIYTNCDSLTNPLISKEQKK